jgi:hypothetical protein
LASTSRNVVIVGGGLSGLFSALLVTDLDPSLKVHVVEKDTALGGGHSSFVDPHGGCFDHGMHLMFDALVPEVDRYFDELQREQDWIVLSGNSKDIAGIYHDGRLQENSPYIDLRRLPDDVRRDCAAGLLEALAEQPPAAMACASTDEFFRRRFGAAITDRIVDPVLQKLWRRRGRELAAAAARIVLLDRILLYDAAAMTDLMKSDRLRARIGFPSQMALPLEYRNAQRGYYPRKFGMFRVIEALAAKLAARGVELHTASELTGMDLAEGAIRRVRIGSGGIDRELERIHFVHWTIPFFALAPKLGVELPAMRFDPALPQAHVYFLLNQPPRMGELYSFYCFDAGYATFRITSYASYCPDARRPDGSWPICVELHFDPGTKIDEAGAAKLAADELLRMGIISDPAAITFQRAVPAKIGFPTLTQSNAVNLARIRELIEARGIRNLITAGFAPERGVFFAHEVLEQNYRGIVSRLGAA